MDIYGVYLVDFKKNVGRELNSKHYAVLLSKQFLKNEKTCIVVPITSKKPDKKYRGGITIDCNKYQTNPTFPKAFIKVNKMREVSTLRFLGKEKIYDLDEEDILKLKNYIRQYLDL